MMSMRNERPIIPGLLPFQPEWLVGIKHQSECCRKSIWNLLNKKSVYGKNIQWKIPFIEKTKYNITE